MKTIIRIEHTDGYGIFGYNENTGKRFTVGDNDILNDILQRHGNDFPTPQQDGLYIYKDNFKWFCAYKSLEELYNWITVDEIKQLISLDFTIWIHDVLNYQEGKYQVIYTKESIISSKNINSLFV